MRNTAMALLFCLISSIAHAQQELPEVIDLIKPMQCVRTNTLFQILERDRQQRQLWVGKDANSSSYISLWINNILGTWTMIQYDGMMACVLGAGEQASAI
jgi:hypothetical protein